MLEFETELTLTVQKCLNVSSWLELSFGTPKDLREIKIILETLDEIWQNLRLRPGKIAYKEKCVVTLHDIFISNSNISSSQGSSGAWPVLYWSVRGIVKTLLFNSEILKK